MEFFFATKNKIFVLAHIFYLHIDENLQNLSQKYVLLFSL